MEISLVLAKFWGALMLAFGLLYLLRPAALKKTIELSADETFSFFAGFQALLLGLGSVSLHNVWTADWRLAITLLGWSAVLKGVLRIGFNRNTAVMTKAFGAPVMRWLLIPLLGFGAWLLYRAYAG